MTEMLSISSRRFDAAFRESFRDLVLWRRDVRRFRREPIGPGLIYSLIELASHAPSVGHCQPWRFVLVESAARRAAVRESFSRANAKAAESYRDQERERYIKLKLQRRQAMASVARRCQRRFDIQSLPRYRHFGLPRAPKGWELAGFRSSSRRSFVECSTYQRHGPSSLTSALASPQRTILIPNSNVMAGSNVWTQSERYSGAEG